MMRCTVHARLIALCCLICTASVCTEVAVAQDDAGHSDAAHGGAIDDAFPDRPLIVATRHVAPFAMQDAETGEWSGITIDLWRAIALERDIEYQFADASIQGMIDGLADGSYDVAAAALTITADRERVIDFTHPYYNAGLGIAVPLEVRAQWLAVVQSVFSGAFIRVLLVLLAMLLIFGVLIWLVERKHNTEQFGGDTISGIGSGFWWSAVTMTTVGYGDKAPVTLPGRLIGLIWMFAAIFAISSITAAITSSLTVASLATSIQGPEDLPRSRVGTLANTTSEQYLSDRLLRPRTYASIEAALEALAEGEIEAVVYDAPILEFTVTQSFDDALTVLPRQFEYQRYGLAVAEGSPMREVINRSMLDALTSDQWPLIERRYLGQ